MQKPRISHPSHLVGLVSGPFRDIIQMLLVGGECNCCLRSYLGEVMISFNMIFSYIQIIKQLKGVCNVPVKMLWPFISFLTDGLLLVCLCPNAGMVSDP